MSTELAATLGILAAAVGILDALPYIRDTLRGRTRPHRGTWLIWGVLAVVAFFSQYADGARWSLVMAATQAVLIGIIFVISIGRGEGGVSAVDLTLIAIAGAGVAGWLLIDEPAVATAFVVVADLIGVAMMVPKTYRDPASETLSTFALASLSGMLATGAVAELDATLLLYPLYFTLANGGIALLIVVRRRALAASPASPVEAASPAEVTAEA
jgi:hypothetical protein